MLFVISNANIILESEKNLNCDIFLKKYWCLIKECNKRGGD